MHGAFLKKTLEKEKIGVLNLIEDEHYFTTLAFVAIDESTSSEIVRVPLLLDVVISISTPPFVLVL